MTTWVAWRPPAAAPTHLATAGFATAAVILVALDLQSPPAGVATNTISAYASTSVATFYVAALIAAAAGVAAAIVAARLAPPRTRPRGLLLLALWPAGIGLATMFDEAEHTFTGMVHNVAVGTAIVAVHIAALRVGSHLLEWIAAAGFACMAVMLGFLMLNSVTGMEMPVGIAERVLVVVSVLLVIGILREPHRRSLPPGSRMARANRI